MFKWPGIPSPTAPCNELADFAELLCWRDGVASTTTLRQSIGKLEENDYSDGVPEEDLIAGPIDAAYLEIERRTEACNGGYPFQIAESGTSLHSSPLNGDKRSIIYKYLLLATRLNMSASRDVGYRYQSKIDGTLLLEELAAESGRGYLGNRAESLVFGTAVTDTNFKNKVNELCYRIQEGIGYSRWAEEPSQTKDGKLDVVVWKHFADRLPGKLIGFGQCKTGTNFKDELTQLQPDSFCRKWLERTPSLPPVRMFFVAEALPIGSWYELASDAGLLFDRCRIVDFSDQVDGKIMSRIRAWTEAAAEANELPNP